MTELFVHSKMASLRSFRLLKVVGDPSYDSEVHCELLETSLDNHPSYEAVSYTWGGQTPTQPVVCEGKRMLVTKNCEDALRRFRPVKDDESRLLWIDSICINQLTDDEAMAERHIQVGEMGHIYHGAHQVLVWLGYEDGSLENSASGRSLDCTSVFQWLASMSDAAIKSTDVRHDDDFMQILDKINISDLEGVFVVVPWFKRLWVVQEVALAKKAILFYGEISLPFEALLRVRHILIDLSTTSARANQAMGALDNGFDIHDRASRMLTSIGSATAPDAADLLDEARFSRASLPKDKVFGLYGFFNALSINLPAPDYTKTDAQIYRETTLGIITSSRKLHILDQVHGLGSTPELVSWAPDWSYFKHAIIPVQGREGSRLVSRLSEPRFSFENDGMHLKVAGVICDRIISRAEPNIAWHGHKGLGPSQEYFQLSQNTLPTDNFWRNMLERNPLYSQAILRVWNISVLQQFTRFAFEDGNEDHMALFATLLSRFCKIETVQRDEASLQRWHATLMGKTLAYQVSVDDKPEAMTWMKETLQQIRNTAQLSPLLDTSEFKIFEALSLTSELRYQHDFVVRISYYQTIFRTEQGRLGMAPRSIQAGDDIAVYSGGRLPMVVRRQDGEQHFRLISMAYVHGIMDGEAWPEEESVLDDIILV